MNKGANKISSIEMKGSTKSNRKKQTKREMNVSLTPPIARNFP